MIEIRNKKKIKEMCDKCQVDLHFTNCNLMTKRFVHYEKGEIVAMYGAKSEKLFFLAQGTIRFSCIADNYEDYFFFDAFSNGLFGEVEYLIDIPIITQSEVVEACDCIEIPIKQNRNILDNDLKFQRFAGQVLAQKYNDIRKQNVNASAFSLRVRLAKYLCETCDEDLNISNLKLIAQNVRCSYRQLLRVMQYFCSVGWIEHLPAKGKYRIIDVKALEHYVINDGNREE